MSVPKFHSIEFPRVRTHVIVEAWLKVHAGAVTIAKIKATSPDQRLSLILKHLLYDEFWRLLYMRAEFLEESEQEGWMTPHMHRPSDREMRFLVNGREEYSFSSSHIVFGEGPVQPSTNPLKELLTGRNS